MASDITSIRVPKSVKDELKSVALEKEPYHATIQRLIRENKQLKQSNEQSNVLMDMMQDEYALKLRAYEKILPNPLTQSGVEHLLNKNIFNELPYILNTIASSIVEFSISANREINNYSDAEMELFVEKSEKLIENIQTMIKENLNGDNSKTYGLNIYCRYLATCIGKSDKYKDSIEI